MQNWRLSLLLFHIMMCFSFQIQAQSYFTNGNAQALGNQCYELTKASGNQNGSVWYANQLDLTKPFDLEFTMNFGNRDAGADGMVFVLQTVGTSALGSNGGGIGFQGFSPSLGIEFDDYYNSVFGDLTADHIGIFKNGIVDHKSSNSLAGPVPANIDGNNIEDGKDHPVRVTWNPETFTIRVWFDCSPRISATIDLVKNVFNNKSLVYWGFTAATGGENNRQMVCLRDDIIIQDTYSVCEGETITLNARESKNNSYVWSPGAFLSSTSVRNPKAAPTKSITYTVTYKDICDNPFVDTVVVLVSGKISVDLGKDTLICQGQNVNFDVGNAYDKIKWENGSTFSTRSISTAGQYFIQVWKNDCTARDTINVAVLAKPRLGLTGPSSFCPGDSVFLTVDVMPQGQDFRWQDGLISTNRYIKKSGNYFISAQNKCGEDTAKHRVDEIMIRDFSLGKDTLICADDTLFLTMPNIDNDVYEWSTGEMDVSIKITEAGKYALTKRKGGCFKFDEIEVFERFVPKIKLDKDVLLCYNERLTLDPKVIDATVFWSNGKRTPTFDLYNFEGQIDVVALNSCGSDSLTLHVRLEECVCDIYLPNAVSPNGDGLNEVFRPTMDCDKLLAYRLSVYNRWGQLLFETYDATLAWDVVYMTNTVQPDVYFWVLQFTGNVNGLPAYKTDAGTLTVLK